MNKRFPKILMRIMGVLECTQRAFADRTGSQPSTITKALTGSRPSELMLQRFCDKSVFEDPRLPVELACAHLKDELELMGLLGDVLVLPAIDKEDQNPDCELDAALEGLRHRADSSALIREMLIDFDAITAVIGEKELGSLEK